MEKYWKNPLVLPPGKILPTPMFAILQFANSIVTEISKWG